MPVAEARALAAAITEAADRAEREQAVEAALPLRDRAWLFLSRLVWWHPRGIAEGLGATEEDVIAEIQGLAAEGKVENEGGTPRGAWKALQKHPRARVDEEAPQKP